MTLQLRNPDDLRRLFSALGEDLARYDATDPSLTDIEIAALQAPTTEFNAAALVLSVLVGLATGWVAIRGYERSGRSMSKGLLWGTAGLFFPLPTLVLTGIFESQQST